MRPANPQPPKAASAQAAVATAVALPPPVDSVLTHCAVEGYDYVTYPNYLDQHIKIGRINDERGSHCFLVREKETGTLYRLVKLKKPTKKKDQSDEAFKKRIDEMERSFDIAIQMKHPNVRAVKAVLPVQEESVDYYYIIKQYILGDFTMDGVILRGTNKRLRGSDAHALFQQAVLGLLYYHRIGIIKNGINPNELAVECVQETNKPCKIFIPDVCSYDTDYRANWMSCGDNSFYSAPEVNSGATPTSDVWSLGCVLYEMITGKRAILTNPNHLVGLSREDTINLIMPPHELITDGLKDLLQHMLDLNPSTRYTLEDVMKHEWFAVGFINPGFLNGYRILNEATNVNEVAKAAAKAPIAAPAASSSADNGPAFFKPDNAASARLKSVVTAPAP